MCEYLPSWYNYPIFRLRIVPQEKFKLQCQRSVIHCGNERYSESIHVSIYRAKAWCFFIRSRNIVLSFNEKRTMIHQDWSIKDELISLNYRQRKKKKYFRLGDFSVEIGAPQGIQKDLAINPRCETSKTKGQERFFPILVQGHLKRPGGIMKLQYYYSLPAVI